jgi:hypothetical protein
MPTFLTNPYNTFSNNRQGPRALYPVGVLSIVMCGLNGNKDDTSKSSLRLSNTDASDGLHYSSGWVGTFAIMTVTPLLKMRMFAFLDGKSEKQGLTSSKA